MNTQKGKNGQKKDKSPKKIMTNDQKNIGQKSIQMAKKERQMTKKKIGEKKHVAKKNYKWPKKKRTNGKKKDKWPGQRPISQATITDDIRRSISTKKNDSFNPIPNLFRMEKQQ